MLRYSPKGAGPAKPLLVQGAIALNLRRRWRSGFADCCLFARQLRLDDVGRQRFCGDQARCEHSVRTGHRDPNWQPQGHRARRGLRGVKLLHVQSLGTGHADQRISTTGAAHGRFQLPFVTALASPRAFCALPSACFSVPLTCCVVLPIASPVLSCNLPAASVIVPLVWSESMRLPFRRRRYALRLPSRYAVLAFR